LKQPGPGGYNVIKPLGKYTIDTTKTGKTAKKETKEEKGGSKKKLHDNFPGPGAYNVMGEKKDNKKEEPKKEVKIKDKEKVEYATYLTDNLWHTSQQPGPGN